MIPRRHSRAGYDRRQYNIGGGGAQRNAMPPHPIGLPQPFPHQAMGDDETGAPAGAALRDPGGRRMALRHGPDRYSPKAAASSGP